MKLRFFISEYSDGNLNVECKHIHYAFRNDLNFDDIAPDDLLKTMRTITETLQKENIVATFQIL